MAAEIIPGLTDAEYDEIDAVRCTDIKKIVSSTPAQYRWEKDNPPAERPAPFVEGSLVHCMTLEPSQVSARYDYPPKVDRRTKEGKAIWEAFCERAEGKDVVTQEVWENCQLMANAVRGNELANGLIDAGQKELVVVWQPDAFPFRLKAKLDVLHGQMIGDLKTTRDASPREFGRSCVNYGYDLQAFWYMAGARACGMDVVDFVFLCVEKTAPHLTALYRATPAMLTRGRYLMRKGLGLYAQCLETGEWPGYEQGVVDVDLPAWALQEVEG